VPRRTDELGILAVALATACSDDPEGSHPKPADTFEVPVLPEAPPDGPSDVLFEPRGGGFERGQSVSLSTPSGMGVIHFTTDGSPPDESSPTYAGPIALSETTMVRAVTVVDGATQQVFAQTYVALEAEAATFSSDLPVIVLERHGDAPIDTNSDDLRVSSVLTFEPGANGRSVLLGEATSSSRAGLRVRGQSSRWFPQKSFAVELWEAGEDEDRKTPWLGMPAESDWVLIAPSHMDRSLMRAMLPMDLSRKIGSYAPRTEFVEVFLVDREGSNALSLDDYIGVYTAAEKIKRDENRVAVDKLDATDLSEPAITGGYMFRIDHGETHFDAGGFGFQWDYPEPEEMQDPIRSAQRDYLQSYIDDFFHAVRDEGDEPYTTYIDSPKWIDHNLVVALTKNVDGLRLSAYFSKDRGAPLVAGPVWDFDRSAGTPHDDRATDPEEWSRGDGTDPLRALFWGELFDHADFTAAYWARWDQLVTTDFSVDSLMARIDEYETQLLEARERHFERWEEMPPQGGPAGEVEILREFYRARVPWMTSQRP
jgi:hypothetical protein